MQKFTILGITLYDYGAREALRNTDRFLGSGGLNTVAYISSAQIAQASRDVELKESVEQLDMTLCTEPDLLEAAGIAARSSCLLYTSPSPRDRTRSRMPSSA